MYTYFDTRTFLVQGVRKANLTQTLKHQMLYIRNKPYGAEHSNTS